MSLTVTLPDGAVEWLRSGERGVSSEAILGHLTGIPICSNRHPAPPSDPGDLARCMKLIDQVPSLRAELHRMAELGTQWDTIVKHWDEITALLREECPEYRGPAPRTWQRMCEVLFPEWKFTHGRLVRR